MIDNYGNQVIPGSLDNGATDTEYTVRPERIICAAEEQFATHKELDAAIADTCDVQDELEARIVALESAVAWLYTQVRLELPTPQAPEGDYAHIPGAEWESVPWGAIKRMLGDIVCAERENLNSTMDDFSDVLNWWIANAPEAAKE